MMAQKYFKFGIIGALFVALAFIRVFENELFYDPFIQFFKKYYFTSKIPDLNFTKLTLNTLFRYFSNTCISLAILYVAFKDKDIIKTSLILYSVSFVLLIGAYTILAHQLSSDTYQIFFFVRRFLIQPIFILLLLPAFYYQRVNKFSNRQ